MHISFTVTRGGAAPVELTLSDLNIEAYSLALALERILSDSITAIEARMKEI